MTIGEARTWVILVSLIVTAGVLVFLWVAPAVLHFPLDASGGDAARLIQIVLPVFLGYLGAASHFAFRHREGQDPTDEIRLSPYAALLIRWPLIGWAFLALVAFGVFWFTNRAAAPPGTGWTVDALATALTVSMGLLAVTTGVAVAFLFGVPGREERGSRPPDPLETPPPPPDHETSA
jgi:hypothetical protein